MELNYLRLSLTDRCNLNCIYCRPKTWVRIMEREKILRFEEMVQFIKVAAEVGVRKVRLTGGEPLLRRNIITLIDMITRVQNIDDITLTTNGICLSEYAKGLKEAGISRINVSLDTLNRNKFIHITGSDGLLKVLKGIEAAKETGIEPVKINVVALQGINDTEINDFVHFALKNSLVLRFIEYMPIEGVGDKSWQISNKVVRSIIEKKWGALEPTNFLGNGPAEYFSLHSTSLVVGFISPISNSFCHRCSRLRLSADGKLRPCLASGYELDVKNALRDEHSQLKIQELIDVALRYKIQKNVSCPAFTSPHKFMFQIGG
ncbi:GTP 3',8-cyclase MoaA [Candidatus Aerophobetes bacterium]|nr:GTP 3',8-cyclase MoaA [Candidatus Aerophobetes bacterium]